MPTYSPRNFRAFAGRVRLRRHWLILAGAVLWLLLCPGSQGQVNTPEDRKPAPSSSLSKDGAIALGNLWRQTDPQKRDFCLVATTGSMVPVLDRRSVRRLEKATAAELRKNDMSIYHCDALSTVCHRVVEASPNGVLLTGTTTAAATAGSPPTGSSGASSPSFLPAVRNPHLKMPAKALSG